MELLTIIGTEDDKLVLVAESGDRFTVAIDDVLRSELAKTKHGGDTPDTPRASPREIQMHVRAGLTAEEVAELLSTTIQDVQRYEAPVVAEREHVVSQALAVPVLIGSEVEPDGSLSFGTAIRAKLADLEAVGEHWASWKDESGWMIKLEFTADEVDHDARWSFDPRRSTLQPQNSAATQLSRQGSLPEGLIPRLRALDTSTPAWKDDSRFDSGAFGPRRLPDPEPEEVSGEETVAQRPSNAADAAINRAPEAAASTRPDTADLLEALRRRRGQREPQPGVDLTDAHHVAPAHAPAAHSGPVQPPVNLFANATPAAAPEGANNAERSDDADRDDEEITAEKQAAADRNDLSGRRKGRTSMPSWDEIVFGARTDE